MEGEEGKGEEERAHLVDVEGGEGETNPVRNRDGLPEVGNHHQDEKRSTTRATQGKKRPSSAHSVDSTASESTMVSRGKQGLQHSMHEAAVAAGFARKGMKQAHRNSVKHGKHILLGDTGDPGSDLEEETTAEKHSRRVQASVKRQKVNLVRHLVPETALGYDQRVHALVDDDAMVKGGEDEDAGRVSTIESEDAPVLAERVMANILERVREDQTKLENYARLVWFLCYMFLFVIAVSLQQHIFTPDQILSYRAVRDEVFGLAGTVVNQDSADDIRDSLSDWDVFIDFLRDNVISTIFTEEKCGNGVCQKQDEWPVWVPASDARSLGGCGVDCGRQVVTPVTVTFFDAWKLREHKNMLDATLATGADFCWQGACFPLETWDAKTPRAGWNICHAHEKEAGVNSTVCVFDGDFFIDGLPFRETELDVDSAFFGAAKTVDLFHGDWELRYGFDGFTWTHPETGEPTTIGFPALRGSICSIDPVAGESAPRVCETWAACPAAPDCGCEFVYGEYICEDDEATELYEMPFEAISTGFDAPELDPVEFDEFAGVEAVADWWRAKTFYGSRAFASLSVPGLGRVSPIEDANIITAEFPVVSPADDAVETVGVSLDVAFDAGWVNADDPVVTLGARAQDTGDDSSTKLMSTTITAFRFRNVDIPSGSTVLSAVLECTSASDQPAPRTPVRLSYRMEDGPDTEPFVTTTLDSQLKQISSRNFTEAVNTSVTLGWLAGEVQRSPDLKDQFQSVLNRDDWRSGNSVVVAVEGIDSTNATLACLATTSSNSEDAVTVLRVEFVRTQAFEFLVTDGADDVTEETYFSGAVFGYGSLNLGDVYDTHAIRFADVPLLGGQKILRAELSLTADVSNVGEIGTDLNATLRTLKRATQIGGDYSTAFEDTGDPSIEVLVDGALDSQPFGQDNPGDFLRKCVDLASPTCNETSVEAVFNIGAFDLADREFTEARLFERVPPLVADGTFTFGDVKKVVQEIIDAPSWTFGGSLLLRLARFQNATHASPAHKFRSTPAERGDPATERGPTLFLIVERSFIPTAMPSAAPSDVPSFLPTSYPSPQPTSKPSPEPSSIPTSAPTACNDRFYSGSVLESRLVPRGSNGQVEVAVDGLCLTVLAIDSEACRNDFCPTCKFAGLCDRTCGFCFTPLPTSFPTPVPTTAEPTAEPTPASQQQGRRRQLQENDGETCTDVRVDVLSSQSVAVHLYEDGDPEALLLDRTLSSSDTFDQCLQTGVCYVIEIEQTTFPHGFRLWFGPNVGLNSPSTAFVRATSDGVFEYESCDDSAGVVDRSRSFPPAVPTDQTGYNFYEDTVGESGRIRCYKTWIGTEARVPTTHYKECIPDPTLYPFLAWEECDVGETHCFYLEKSGANTAIDSDLCYTFHRVGGCWSTLEKLWSQTGSARSVEAYDESGRLYFNGSAAPERGSLSKESCANIGTLLFGSDSSLIDCVGCEGDRCERQDPDFYDNAMGISSNALEAAAESILELNSVLDLDSASIECDSVRTVDNICDETYNHIGCNWDGGACCRVNEADESVCEPPAPWLESADKTWRYSIIVNGQVYATVPKALFRAVIDVLALEAAGGPAELETLAKSESANEFLITRQSFQSAAVHVTNIPRINKLLAYVPSLACPECNATASRDGKNFRTVPFSVNVTYSNADGFYNWHVINQPDQDCWYIETTCIPASGEQYCCELLGVGNLLASDACQACGAALNQPEQHYTTFDNNDEPRARYLSFPNLVMYGPILTQTSRRKGDGCNDIRPYNSKLTYLDTLRIPASEKEDPDPGMCHAGETKSDYGVDATYADTSELYNEANVEDLLQYYNAEFIVGGQPRGFGYAMGRDSTGSNYPIYWDVNLNRTQALKLVTLLEDGNYFDEFTREVSLSIVTTNRNAESQIIVFFEVQVSMRETGGMEFEYMIQVIDTVIPRYGPWDWKGNSSTQMTLIVVEFLFIIVLITLLGNEAAELTQFMCKLGVLPGIGAYFSSLANWLDLTSYIVTAIMIFERINYIAFYNRVIDNLDVHYDVYAAGLELRLGRILEYNENMEDLQDAIGKIKELSDMQIVYKVLMTCAIMLMVLELLKAFDFHPRMGIITRTVTRAGYSLTFWFGLQFCISLLYAVLAVILFSQSSEGFGSDDVTGLLESQFGFSLLAASGMYDPESFKEIPGFNLYVEGLSFYVTQALFWSYLFISFFIMFNALLAIIVGAYDEVSDEMKRAHRDPLPFAVKRWFGASGVPGGALSVNQLSCLLEAWVGEKLDIRVSSKDDLNDIITKMRRPPQKLNPKAQEILKTHHLQFPRSSMFYRFKASPQDPVMAMEANFLALIARIYSEYYLGLCDPAKLTCTTILGKKKTIKPLDAKAGVRFAANILARYGSNADLDESGDVSAEESQAIRKLVVLLPHIVDEDRDPRERLVTAYRYYYDIQIADPKRDPDNHPPPDDNRDVVLASCTSEPQGIGARGRRKRHRLLRRRTTHEQILTSAHSSASEAGCCQDWGGGVPVGTAQYVNPETQSLAYALELQRAQLLQAQSEGRLGP